MHLAWRRCAASKYYVGGAPCQTSASAPLHEQSIHGRPPLACLDHPRRARRDARVVHTARDRERATRRGDPHRARAGHPARDALRTLRPAAERRGARQDPRPGVATREERADRVHHRRARVLEPAALGRRAGAGAAAGHRGSGRGRARAHAFADGPAHPRRRDRVRGDRAGAGARSPGRHCAGRRHLGGRARGGPRHETPFP